MKRKLTSDPVNRKEDLNRFAAALANLAESNEVYSLLPPQQYSLLGEIKKLIEEVTNPHNV
jgi:hypothetical protein